MCGECVSKNWSRVGIGAVGVDCVELELVGGVCPIKARMSVWPVSRLMGFLLGRLIFLPILLLTLGCGSFRMGSVSCWG